MGFVEGEFENDNEANILNLFIVKYLSNIKKKGIAY